MPNAGKYKWERFKKIQGKGLRIQGKGLRIQINNKTIIEFGSRRI